MQRELNTDPLRNYRFNVDIHWQPRHGSYQSLKNLGFMSVSGLAATTEPVSYREGGHNTTPRKMPGQTDFPPLSLTRGVVGSTEARQRLFQWHRQIFSVVQGYGQGNAMGTDGLGRDFRATVYIFVLGSPETDHTRRNPGEPHSSNPRRASWKLYNCWPTSLAFSDLDAGANGLLVQNMTLMYEGFDFATDNRVLSPAW